MKHFIILSLFLLIIILGVWVSTQQVAAALAYQPQLEPILFYWDKTPIYPPMFFNWWLKYGKIAPKQFNDASNYMFISVLFGVICLVGGLALDKKKEEVTHLGSAHWADEKNLKKSGLLNNKGVMIGTTEEGKYLRHNGSEHLMVMAPTRSGKGVGIIIPTLLTWEHSVLITDIKGENWGITAGHRREELGNKVLKFDPTSCDGSSVRYNPLDEIRIGTVHEVRDVQNITDILVDPQGKGDLNHWDKTGHALLVGVILHLKYTLPKATLSDIASFLSNPNKNFEDSLEEMRTYPHSSINGGLFKQIYKVDTETHPVIAKAAREVLNKAPNERSGVLSTANTILSLYHDPIVADNTAYSEFSISDLMNHEQPVSLYLIVPPSDINRTRPLIRMILNQVVRRLTEKMDFKNGKPIINYKHRLLLLLDEFPALGKLDAFESALAFIAGYGLKALLIIQSLNQLNKTYSQNNSIVDNCHIRIVYAPNDEKTPEFVSHLLGTKTEVMETKSYQGGRFDLWLPKVTRTTHYVSRPLLTPGEVTQLPDTEEVIFIAGTPPIKAQKIKYYEDENFCKCLLDAPEKTDIICKVEIPEGENKETKLEEIETPKEPDKKPNSKQTKPEEDNFVELYENQYDIEKEDDNIFDFKV